MAKKIIILCSSEHGRASFIEKELRTLYKDLYQIESIDAYTRLDIVVTQAVDAVPDMVIFHKLPKGTCNFCMGKINFLSDRGEKIEYFAQLSENSKLTEELDPKIIPISEVTELYNILLQKKIA